MHPRLVDERDTEWESTDLDIRVFIARPGGEVEAYDLDSARFDEAENWARDEATGDSLYSIAIRQSSRGDEGPGLLWIHDFAGLADDVRKLTTWVERSRNPLDPELG